MRGGRSEASNECFQRFALKRRGSEQDVAAQAGGLFSNFALPIDILPDRDHLVNAKPPYRFHAKISPEFFAFCTWCLLERNKGGAEI